MADSAAAEVDADGHALNASKVKHEQNIFLDNILLLLKTCILEKAYIYFNDYIYICAITELTMGRQLEWCEI